MKNSKKLIVSNTLIFCILYLFSFSHPVAAQILLNLKRENNLTEREGNKRQYKNLEFLSQEYRQAYKLPYAEITLMEFSMPRPPFAQLKVNIRLHNPDNRDSEWFFIPASYSSYLGRLDNKQQDYARLQVRRYGGRGNAIVSELSGENLRTLYGIFLPPKTEVILKNIPIQYYVGEYVGYSERTRRFEKMYDENLPIQIFISSPRIDNQYLESWLNIESLGNNRGEVDYEKLEEILAERDISNRDLDISFGGFSLRFVLNRANLLTTP